MSREMTAFSSFVKMHSAISSGVSQVISADDIKTGVGNCFGSGATLWKQRLAEGHTF
jgi:hypothetical protein